MKWQCLKRVAFSLAGTMTGMIVLLAIASFTPRKWGNLPPSGDCEFTLYVSGGVMHTDLFVPVQNSAFEWNQVLNLKELSQQPGTNDRYLQFSWGDRIFFMETPSWDQMNWGSALRSLFYWNNSAAMLIKGHRTLPQYPDTENRCIRLGREDYRAIMQFITNSLERNAQGQPHHLGYGQDRESSFYAATGRYSIVNTCNSWTAEALRSGNINTPLWGGIAPSILYHLRNGCSCVMPDSAGTDLR